MRWLLAQGIRPFIRLAAFTSLLLNLALLAPALYMLQVFDRVFASGSVETLVMLGVPVLIMLALGYYMDAARARSLAAAGRRVESCLAPEALASQLEARAAGARRDDDALRDVAQLRKLLASPGVVALFDAPWVPIYLVIITLMHPLLGGIATLGALALFALGMLTEYLTRRHADGALTLVRATQRQADSLLRNAECVVAMGMTGAALADWQSRCDQQHQAQEKLSQASARLGALARMSRQGLQALALGFGAWLVIGREASPGIMIAATILLGRALQPVELLIGGWKSMIEARGAWQRLCERQLRTREARLALPAAQGSLEVERLGYAMSPERPLLRGVSFSVRAGESLGIVGPSASGKTTLLRLLLGMRAPQTGKVRLDGADISRWDREALGRQVGYLPQDVELFAGSISANIARLQKPDAQAVIRAAKLAHAHDLILRLPDGYDTEIGEGGCFLSGGQKQRIALARALYGDPRFVVLDEPNANLDEEGDAALAATLAELKTRGVTVVVVTHRRSLTSRLDRIAVLQNGKIETFGYTAQVLARLAETPKVVAFPAHDARQVSA